MYIVDGTVANPDLSRIITDEDLITEDTSAEGDRIAVPLLHRVHRDRARTSIGASCAKRCPGSATRSCSPAPSARRRSTSTSTIPSRLRNRARFGDVTAEKADDMHRQQHSTHEGNARFAVITDSAADIPDEDMERLDIHMVPCAFSSVIAAISTRSASRRTSSSTSSPQSASSDDVAAGARRFPAPVPVPCQPFPDVISVNLTRSRQAEPAGGGDRRPKRVDAPGTFTSSIRSQRVAGPGTARVWLRTMAEAGRDVRRNAGRARAAIP